MSLRGRYLIDRCKRAIGSSFQLPVPPYADAEYWNAAYRGFGPQDCFEWGDVELKDLNKYEHRQLDWETGKVNSALTSTTLAETLGVSPNGDKDEPLLMLGCGNSRLGEQMLEHGWRGPMIQVDVSSRVIESMSQRCVQMIQTGSMKFIQDDAAELSAFRNDMISACLDKGLMDAIFCADEYDQCQNILKSVHRVLRPGGVFVFLSFSRPEFLLPKVVDSDYRRNRALWQDVQIQELSKIMLYKFQKVQPTNRQIKPKATSRVR